MKILLCPDSFKESISARDLCRALSEGLAESGHTVRSLPLSDGGEGMLDALVPPDAQREVPTLNANLQPIRGKTGWHAQTQTAVIESAQALGLGLVAIENRDPMHASSRGLGMMIKEALKLNPKKIIVGIGGSATNDGGAGMLKELSFRLLDREGTPIPEGNAGLALLSTIESPLNHPVFGTELIVATDVNNPLTGPEGATYVYARQKGAKEEQLEAMDNHLQLFLDKTEAHFQHPCNFAGAGAAGGLGMALYAYLKASIEPGFQLVSRFTNLARKVSEADLIVTGEGKIDHQTLHGKVPAGVLQLAREHGKPVIAVCGVFDSTGFPPSIFDRVFSINREGLPPEESMSRAYELAVQTGFFIAEHITNGELLP